MGDTVRERLCELANLLRSARPRTQRLVGRASLTREYVVGVRSRIEVAAWTIASAAAGTGVMVLSRGTAPVQTDGDWFDSDLFLPLTLGLALLTAAAGYRVPRLPLLFGVAAAAPYLAAALGVGFDQTAEQEAFMWVGFLFTAPFATIPLFGSLVGSYFGARRVAEQNLAASE